MKGLLTPPLRAGVYEVVDAADLVQRLRHAGWHVGTVDLADARKAVGEIGHELGFPSYYGRNLDALNDSLSDLVRATALVVRVPSTLDPYAAAMLDVLTDAADQGAVMPFALVRVTGASRP